MSTFAIGDIHGCLAALDTLLDAVGPTADDTVVTLGDYTDRGPDSRTVLDRLIALADRTQLVPLRGNHDQMLCEARDSDAAFRTWFGFGGEATLASYGVPAARAARRDLTSIPPEHWQFLENLLDIHETDTHFFVHALADPDTPLDQQSAWTLRWSRFYDPPPHMSGKVMVAGHTAQHTGEPANLGHAVCIDTWVFGDGWLTCLDTGAGRLWQANQQGQLRTAHLDQYLQPPAG